MAPSLKDKVCLITGASSGIGEATALELARRGAFLIVASRRIERLEDLAERILEGFPGCRILPYQLDVLEPDQITRCVERSLSEFNRIDLLFNNAGFGRLKWLEALDIERGVQNQIDVNLTGMILMSRAILPTMQAQRSGHIINMSSTMSAARRRPRDGLCGHRRLRSTSRRWSHKQGARDLRAARVGT